MTQSAHGPEILCDGCRREVNPQLDEILCWRCATKSRFYRQCLQQDIAQLKNILSANGIPIPELEGEATYKKSLLRSMGEEEKCEKP